MKLHVTWNALTAAPALRQHLERRLAFALGRFSAELSQVRARLADINGPRGGVDKLVSVHVRGRRLGSLMVCESDANLYAAIDRAADRIGLAIGRALGRANGRSRRHPELLPERARTVRRR